MDVQSLLLLRIQMVQPLVERNDESVVVLQSYRHAL